MHIGKCSRRVAASSLAIAAALVLALGLAPAQGNEGGGSHLLSHPEAAYASERPQATEESATGAADGKGPAASLGAPVGTAQAAGAGIGSQGPAAPLASTFAGPTASVVSADVALDAGEPLVGSFTEGGLTYAVGADGLALAAVDPAAVGEGGILAIPASAAFDGAAYPVVAVDAFAFYLSGATDVALPASIASVDERAFRSSDVGRVEVGPDNPNLASSDGALYSADLTRLLLIPGGRQGAVRIDSHAEEVPSSAFSHCAGVTAISVDAGGAAYSSWEGSLYDASGQTLLRVPAGAAEITIRDGCTAIAAGAMEGCASLERINAPSSVASISPDVFTSIPTIELPAQLALRGEENPGVASSLLGQSNASTDFAPQLTAMVALLTIDDDLPEANSTQISVYGLEEGVSEIWQERGFLVNASSELAPSNEPSIQGSMPYQSFNEPISHVIIAEPHWRSTPAGGNDSASSSLPNYYYPEPCDYVNYSPWPGIIHSESLSFYIHYGNTGAAYSLSDIRGAQGAPSFYCFQCDSIVTWKLGTGGSHIHADRSVKALLSTFFCWKPNGGQWKEGGTTSKLTGCDNVRIARSADGPQDGSQPVRPGYCFAGWNTQADGSGTSFPKGTAIYSMSPTNLFAQWEPVIIDFDTSSEPGDEDYPGEDKSSLSVPDSVDDEGRVEVSDPKRPGYVFEGWVIPSADGTEAVDQELVYQDSDGKWYVDASKLPDYAGDDGRVELTARWTSVISVDVPQSVTFYADTVTQGQESREGAASSAFGQNKAVNQSEVDLRVVGLESEAVKTDGSTLGADSVLKKAEAATPSTSAGKLLSLYPSAKQWTADELQDPDEVGGTKDASAVDFDLDDILLEKSFPSDAFTIPAGDTLNMGYRLNLAETGQQLDYDKLSTLEDGQSAAIANVSYCFSSDGPPPFWTHDGEDFVGLPRIKSDAEKIAAGDTATTEKYQRWLEEDHRFYLRWYDKGISEADARSESDSTVYEVRIIGINHDDKADGSGKAGLTFQFVDCLNSEYAISNSKSTKGGWPSSALRTLLNTTGGTVYRQVPLGMRNAIALVRKQSGTTHGSSAMAATDDSFFLLSMREIWGRSCGSWTEGSQYPYFKRAVLYDPAYPDREQPLLQKKRDGARWTWGLRTIGTAESYKAVSRAGYSALDSGYGAYIANQPGGVSPAFCL